MPAEHRVSVVVLSYDRPRALARALGSIRAQTRRPDEVIVVDNPSPSSPEIGEVAARFPEFTFVRSDVNRGFAGGMNLGLRRAAHPWVFLTEDDVVLEPDCLAALLEAGAAIPGPGLLSGIMIDDGTDTILSAGGEVRLDGIYHMTVIDQGKPASAIPRTAPYDVQYIPGAMILARREVWGRLGGFREDFFVYGEDSDLCFRARRADIRIVVAPRARVRHLPARSDASPVVAYHKLKNFLALYLLHARPRALAPFVVRYVALPLIRGGQRGLHLRALGWVLPRVPSLLRDRGEVRPVTATVE